MASQPPPPPPATPTSITDIGDDLLREIFLRILDLPCLVRAAFACRAFRRAVRSSPAFRRSFHAVHAPPLLALFFEPNMEAVPVLPSCSRRSDPGLLATDFFGIGLSRDRDPRATGWEIQSWNPSAGGYLILVKERGSGLKTPKCRASYSPLTQALCLSIYQPDKISFEFYTLFSEDGQGPSGVVCARHERRSSSITAVVFSSDTMAWQIPRTATVRLCDPSTLMATVVVRGLICWRDWMHEQIVVFDTATCHFSLIDLPAPLLTEAAETTYMLGDTKDGKFCIVDILPETLSGKGWQEYALVSWFMTTTDHGSVVEPWMFYKKLSLQPVFEHFTGCSFPHPVSLDLVAVISGYVYVSILYCTDRRDRFELYLSICLETLETRQLFKGNNVCIPNEEARPYIMRWPPSLVQAKEESATEFTGDSVAGVRTEEASTLLVTALRSLGQALMNDSDSNREIVAELDAFLAPTEDDEGSIITKMATFDAQLRSGRDAILRLRA